MLLCCSVLAGPSAAGAERSREAFDGGVRPALPGQPRCEPAPLETRAAAVLVVGLPGVVTGQDPLVEELTTLGVGGVFLSEGNVRSSTQVRALVEDLRARSARPLLVTTDEESGRVAVTRAVVGSGPSPRRLAQQGSPVQVREFAADLGVELADLGVDLDLAPSVDLDDGRWDGVIGDRSFSGDPKTAARYGLAFAAGLQDGGVTPTVKHFPGHGRSATDTHREGDVVTTGLLELGRTDLLPFRRAIDAGAPVVMLNHLEYSVFAEDLPASVNPDAYALLRSLGFRGIAMTDSLGMGAVNLRWDFPEAAVLAVDAGADAVLATDGRQARRMRDALVAAVHAGTLDEERLTWAAARVTALAGGDVRGISCLEVELPELHVAGASGLGPALEGAGT